MKNNFRHQTYSADQPAALYELLNPEFPAQPEIDAFGAIAKQFGERIGGKIQTIYLVHGSFVGDDALGWTAQISKLFPGVGSQITTIGKRLVDLISGESGNFTEEFRSLLENSICRQQQNVAVKQFVWSSENTHTGRARAAIELLHELLESGQSKFLFLCHSHGGNVLALLTNLLGAGASEREQFLEIMRPLFVGEGEAVFTNVWHFLQTKTNDEFEINVVTMGTPVRYGWEPARVRCLLHFVNHCPEDGCAEYLSPLPRPTLDALKSMKGDLIQQIGIASTNFLPFLFDRQLLNVEKSMGQLIQAGIERIDIIERLKIGMRVHDTGKTLLVNYDNHANLAKRMAGHAIYTRPEWLAFHLNEIGRRIF